MENLNIAVGDNPFVSNGEPRLNHVPSFREEIWSTLTTSDSAIFGMYINCCYFCVVLRASQAKELPVTLTLFFFFFYRSPMKIRQDRLRKMKKPVHFIGFKTIDNSWNDEKMRALALRRNVAEKPRGMRLKFVLSQLRLCTHESKNRFVFFKSLKFYCEQETVKSNPVNLGGVSFNLVSRSHSGRGRSGYEIRGRLKRPFKVHVKNTEKN